MITEKLNPSDKPVVSLAGGVATRNAFVVFDTATNEQLVTAMVKVREMEGATAWWLGDIGLALQDRRQAELAVKAAECRNKAAELDGSVPEQAAVKNGLLEQAEELENGAETKYRNELCAALDIDAGYLANCVSLARFYPPSSRNEGLRVKHHVVAMNAAKKDAGKAQQWLNEARSEGLAASDLRRRLAEAKAPYKAPETPPERFEFSELSRADEWAKRFREKVLKLTPEEATAILTQMTELRALAFQLESIAKGMS
jgi:hypothetical protein